MAFQVGQRVVLIRDYLFFEVGDGGVVKQVTEVGVVAHMDFQGGVPVNPAIPIGPLHPAEDYFESVPAAEEKE